MDFPPFCGPLGDLNRDPICRRAKRIYALRSWAEDVADTARAAERARNSRRAAGLRRWVATVGAQRLADVERWLTELPECTHPADQRAELTYEQAMPACTC